MPFAHTEAKARNPHGVNRTSFSSIRLDAFLSDTLYQTISRRPKFGNLMTLSFMPGLGTV